MSLPYSNNIVFYTPCDNMIEGYKGKAWSFINAISGFVNGKVSGACLTQNSDTGGSLYYSNNAPSGQTSIYLQPSGTTSFTVFGWCSGVNVENRNLWIGWGDFTHIMYHGVRCTFLNANSGMQIRPIWNGLPWNKTSIVYPSWNYGFNNIAVHWQKEGGNWVNCWWSANGSDWEILPSGNLTVDAGGLGINPQIYINTTASGEIAEAIDEVIVWKNITRPSNADLRLMYNLGVSGLPLTQFDSSPYQAFSGYRLMPLGDAITVGIGDETNNGGYRGPLCSLLSLSGINCDFVGTQNDGILLEPDHEGHDGYTSSQILSNIDKWCSFYPLDFVLLHIGTSDISNGVDNATIISNISGIISTIKGWYPDCAVITAKLINRDDPYSASGLATTQLNNLIESSFSDVVDMENALTYPGDMHDDKYPNGSGYNKMAIVWYNKIASILQERQRVHYKPLYPSQQAYYHPLDTDLWIDGAGKYWISGSGMVTPVAAIIGSGAYFNNVSEYLYSPRLESYRYPSESTSSVTLAYWVSGISDTIIGWSKEDSPEVPYNGFGIIVGGGSLDSYIISNGTQLSSFDTITSGVFGGSDPILLVFRSYRGIGGYNNYLSINGNAWQNLGFRVCDEFSSADHGVIKFAETGQGTIDEVVTWLDAPSFSDEELQQLYQMGGE